MVSVFLKLRKSFAKVYIASEKSASFQGACSPQAMGVASGEMYYGWIILLVAGCCAYFSGPGQTSGVSTFIEVSSKMFSSATRDAP